MPLEMIYLDGDILDMSIVDGTIFHDKLIYDLNLEIEELNNICKQFKKFMKANDCMKLRIFNGDVDVEDNTINFQFMPTIFNGKVVDQIQSHLFTISISLDNDSYSCTHAKLVLK